MSSGYNNEEEEEYLDDVELYHDGSDEETSTQQIIQQAQPVFQTPTKKANNNNNNNNNNQPTTVPPSTVKKPQAPVIISKLEKYTMHDLPDALHSQQEYQLNELESNQRETLAKAVTSTTALRITKQNTTELTTLTTTLMNDLEKLPMVGKMKYSAKYKPISVESPSMICLMRYYY
eukprot:UN04366